MALPKGLIPSSQEPDDPNGPGPDDWEVQLVIMSWPAFQRLAVGTRVISGFSGKVFVKGTQGHDYNLMMEAANDARRRLSSLEARGLFVGFVDGIPLTIRDQLMLDQGRIYTSEANWERVFSR